MWVNWSEYYTDWWAFGEYVTEHMTITFLEWWILHIAGIIGHGLHLNMIPLKELTIELLNSYDALFLQFGSSIYMLKSSSILNLITISFVAAHPLLFKELVAI